MLGQSHRRIGGSDCRIEQASEQRLGAALDHDVPMA
jgi:hypothetical protein